MSKQVNITDSVSIHPTGTTGASNMSASSSYPASNAYADSNSDSYARYSVTRNSTGLVYFTFTTPTLPSGATITSITATVRVYVNNTSYVTNTQCQLYSNTTAKGSNYTFASTANTNIVNMTNTGSWTVSELANLRLKIGGTSNNSGNSKYILIYGATVTINYTVSGTAYTITTSSSVNDTTIEPATQDVLSGNSAEVRIDSNDLSGLSITDNGNDISNLLTAHALETTYTNDRVLGTYTLVSGSFNGSGASYFQGLAGKGVNNTTTTSNYYSSGSGTIAVFTYDMSFTGIPSNAIITRVYCQINGHAESTSNSNEYMCAQLISGNTNLSSELNFKSIGTSNSTQTIECTTIPTVAQLASMKLQCRLGYYGGAINGATCYVEYQAAGSSGYYWTYELTNVSADHTILIAQGITNALFIKQNNQWVTVSKVYAKENGVWVEKALSYLSDNNIDYLQQGVMSPVTEQWETIYDGLVHYYYEQHGDYPYCWLADIRSYNIEEGSVWRITYNNVSYRCVGETVDSAVYIGNPKYDMKTDNNTDTPLCFYNYNNEAWTGAINLPNIQDNIIEIQNIKIERLIT